MQNELKNASSELERTLKRDQFKNDVTPSNLYSEEEQVTLLNKKYQPYLEQVQEKYPHLGLGILARDLDRIIAISGVNSDKLQKRQRPQVYYRIYETNKMEIIKNIPSVAFNGKPITNVQYPIVVDGRVIGHVWASYKNEDIDSAINALVFRLTNYFVLIWLGSLLAIQWVFNGFKNAIGELCDQIKLDDTRPEQFEKVPELIPLVNTITEQRDALEMAYSEREKMLREIEKLNREDLLGEMAASFAHEIRNPMTSVQGFLQYAKNRADSKIAGYMDTALDELAHANRVIDDFLALARNRYVEKSPEKINEIIERLAPIIYADCMQKGISFKVDLQDIPEILASSKEIKQLILNITRNALEAMDNNGILKVQTSFNKGKVILRITDNGKGIPEEDKNTIFEPFYTTKEAGTGLGLVVCKNIVEHHSGKTVIHSEVGKGTEFEICFPSFIKT